VRGSLFAVLFPTSLGSKSWKSKDLREKSRVDRRVSGFGNPNGIQAFSPGLARNAGLPWVLCPYTRQPCRGWSIWPNDPRPPRLSSHLYFRGHPGSSELSWRGFCAKHFVDDFRLFGLADTRCSAIDHWGRAMLPCPPKLFTRRRTLCPDLSLLPTPAARWETRRDAYWGFGLGERTVQMRTLIWAAQQHRPTAIGCRLRRLQKLNSWRRSALSRRVGTIALALALKEKRVKRHKVGKNFSAQSPGQMNSLPSHGRVGFQPESCNQSSPRA